jgi:hypothetical protein
MMYVIDGLLLWAMVYGLYAHVRDRDANRVRQSQIQKQWGIKDDKPYVKDRDDCRIVWEDRD